MRERISESLHALMHQYRHQLRLTAIAANITLPVTHIRTLKCIDKLPNCSAKNISEKLQLDKAQVARVIQELVELQFIEKKRSSINHRTFILTLTASGVVIMNKLADVEETTTQRMTNNLTKQQVEDFIRIAEQMVMNISITYENQVNNKEKS